MLASPDQWTASQRCGYPRSTRAMPCSVSPRARRTAHAARRDHGQARARGSHPPGPAGRALLQATRGPGRQLVDALGNASAPAGARPARSGRPGPFSAILIIRLPGFQQVGSIFRLKTEEEGLGDGLQVPEALATAASRGRVHTAANRHAPSQAADTVHTAPEETSVATASCAGERACSPSLLIGTDPVT